MTFRFAQQESSNAREMGQRVAPRRLARAWAAGLMFAGTLAAAEELAGSYRNTAPGVAYVGSKACAACHSQIYARYRSSAMGRSMAEAGVDSLPSAAVESATVHDTRLNRHFRVFRQGAEIYQSQYETDAAGETVFTTTHRLEYAVGSGVNGFSYIVRRGDHLFQAPLSFYARTRKWDLSPGYEFGGYGFNRPIAAACIACHSGQPRPVSEREGLFRNPPFRELAIGCENCHGPGQLHVAERGGGVQISGGVDRSIVNPRRLPARLADQICMNCHQGGDARVLQPGKDYFDFRPGTWLNETLAIFKIGGPREAETDLLEHHSSMQSSRCYAASDGKLSCLTCHNPHSMPSLEQAAAVYRGKCLTCHSGASCKLSMKERNQHRPPNDCAGCHMAKRDVTVISHSALTNHRITARPGQPAPEARWEGRDLVHVNPPGGPGREALPPLTLFQAYGELIEKQPAFEERYVALLEQLLKDKPKSALVMAAYGRKLLRDPAPQLDPRAIQYLFQAVELGSTVASTFQDLAEALARAGRMDEAVGILERGIALAPYASTLYKSLAVRYIALKRYPKAYETMKRYMELFPDDAFMRGMLRRAEELNRSAPPAPAP
ncbi:MAG: hypothetical protein HY013_19900 [Candidatus Solibacter usitatus]|nr:hypothetical protein [Candidatus Solibacter usitatus]